MLTTPKALAADSLESSNQTGDSSAAAGSRSRAARVTQLRELIEKNQYEVDLDRLAGRFVDDGWILHTEKPS